MVQGAVACCLHWRQSSRPGRRRHKEETNRRRPALPWANIKFVSINIGWRIGIGLSHISFLLEEREEEKTRERLYVCMYGTFSYLPPNHERHACNARAQALERRTCEVTSFIARENQARRVGRLEEFSLNGALSPQMLDCCRIPSYTLSAMCRAHHPPWCSGASSTVRSAGPHQTSCWSTNSMFCYDTMWFFVQESVSLHFSYFVAFFLLST
jgi:hypothetical protein